MATHGSNLALANQKSDNQYIKQFFEQKIVFTYPSIFTYMFWMLKRTVSVRWFAAPIKGTAILY